MDKNLQHYVTVKNTFIEIDVTEDALIFGQDGGALSPCSLRRQGSEPVLSSGAFSGVSVPMVSRASKPIAKDELQQAQAFEDLSRSPIRSLLLDKAPNSKHPQSQFRVSELEANDSDLTREDTDENWPTWKDNDRECPTQSYAFSDASGMSWRPPLGVAAPGNWDPESQYLQVFEYDSLNNSTFECDSVGKGQQPSLELAMRAMNAADPDAHPCARAVISNNSVQARKMRRRKRKSSIDIAFAAAAKADTPTQPQDGLERQVSSTSSDSMTSRNRESICHSCKMTWKDTFKFCGFCGVSLSAFK